MTTNWTDAASAEDVWDGAGTGVIVAGRDIALFRVGNEFFATENRCSHGNARLCEGFVEGFEIECPLHQGRFDLRTGAPTCAPAAEPVKTWPLRVEGGRVWVSLGD